MIHLIKCIVDGTLQVLQTKQYYNGYVKTGGVRGKLNFITFLKLLLVQTFTDTTQILTGSIAVPALANKIHIQTSSRWRRLVEVQVALDYDQAGW